MGSVEHGRQPHEIEGLDGRDVKGLGQGLADQDRPAHLAVIVLGHVRPAQLIDELCLGVPDERSGRPSLLKGGHIGDRLDGGARLPQAHGDVHLTIDLGIVEIGAAQHGQHFAGVRLEGNQRGVGRVTVLQVFQMGPSLLLSDVLQA